MPHLRYNIQNWPVPIAKLPACYSVKAVDNVQLLAEAKAVNPHIVRILRHYTDDQNPADTYEGNKAKARQFLKTFIDGTFLEGETKGVPHRTTEYIEDWNEYGWFESQNAAIKHRFRLWAIAFLDVWYEEYWPDLGTNVMVGNIPVGNDLDFEVAQRVAYWTDLKKGRVPRVGYHGYWPVQNKQIVGQDHEDGWWKWYAGRILDQDQALLARNIRIHYAITESGAIGARGTWPDIHLGPEDGWREGYVHGGDMDSYLITTDMFMKKWSAWNEDNGYRCLSPNMYDSSQGQDEWKQFQLWSRDLQKIVDHVFTRFPTAEPEPPPPPPPPPPPVVTAHGIDVSRWQGTMDWDKTAEQDVSFVFIKATQGSGWTDPQYRQNWASSFDKGIYRGPYHFFEPEMDYIKQANHFVDVVESTGIATDLPFVADVEKAPVQLTGKAFRAGLIAFILKVFQRTKVKPLIYTSPGFYNRWLHDPEMEKSWGDISDLWIAHWGVSKPTVPPAWGDWVFWQYDVIDKGRTYGAQSSRIDVNWFNGNLEDLKKYVEKEPPVTTDQYQLVANSNIRLQPRFVSEAGQYNKVVTLPAGSIVKVTAWVAGDLYQDSDKWAALDLMATYLNGETPFVAYIHSKLIKPAEL